MSTLITFLHGKSYIFKTFNEKSVTVSTFTKPFRFWCGKTAVPLLCVYSATMSPAASGTHCIVREEEGEANDILVFLRKWC